MMFNDSQLIDVCLAYFSDEGTEQVQLEKMKTLITKPNVFINKLYLDMFSSYEIINYLCLQASHVIEIDI